MIAGRYEFQSEIGRGGMGAVWQAHDTLLDRAVAMKRLGGIGTADGPDRQRAQREAMLAARLNHPHMVSVFDLVEDEDGWAWLVMEFVPGISLAQAIAEAPLQSRAVARIGQQVAEALSAAHAAGIVHRDVKPSNILLTQDGRAKLSDFGIARSENDDALTRTGEVTGSPAYLPPEVARGAKASQAGDMWSLGATLYHASSGQKPYTSSEGNAMSVLFRIVQDPPPQLPASDPLSTIVGQLMTFEAEGRPTAAGAAVALAVVAGGAAPIAAPVDSPTQATAVVAPVAAPISDATQAIGTVGPAPVEPEPEPERRDNRWLMVAGGAAVALVLLAVLALALGVFSGDDEDPTDDPTPTPAQTTEPTPDETTAPTPTPTPTPSETPSPAPTTAPPTTAPPTTPPPTATTTPPTSGPTEPTVPSIEVPGP